MLPRLAIGSCCLALSNRQQGRAQSAPDMARPRTGNEDIHQPLGALLPVGTRSHVGHSDKCPKQVENEVGAAGFSAGTERSISSVL